MAKNKRDWAEINSRKGKRFVERDETYGGAGRGRNSKAAKMTRAGKSAGDRNAKAASKGERRGFDSSNRSYDSGETLPSNGIIGRNPVMEALRNDREIEKILVGKGAEGSITKIIGIAKDKGIPIYQSDKLTLDRIAAGAPHQGVIAYASAYSYSTMEDIYAKAEASGEPPLVVILDNLEDPHNLGAIMRTAECAGAHGVIIPKRRSVGLTEASGEPPLVVILDNLEDPHNLGAIMRTAECAGAHGVIIPKRRSVGLTDTVAKSSAGAIEYMPCVKVANIGQTIDQLKEEGFWVAACDMDGVPYYEQDLTGKLAIVIGSEGAGISQLVKKKCDFTVSMPMVGKITSLNASNAAAVLMYEVRRQRDGRK